MKSLFKIFSILAPADLRRCFILWLAMLLGAVFEALGIGAIMPLLSIMGEPHFLNQREEIARRMAAVGVATHEQFIVFIAGLLIVLYIFKNAYLVWLVKWQSCYSMRLQVEYARSLFAIYLRKPYPYYLEHNTATLLHKTYDGPMTVFSNIFLPILYLFTEIFTAVAICIFLLWVDSVAASLVIIGFGGIIYGVGRFFRGRIRRQGEISARCSSEMFQWVNQGLGAIKETRILGRESYFYAMYDIAYQKFGNANEQVKVTISLPRFFIESFVVVGWLLLIIGQIYSGQTPNEILPLLGVLAMAAFRLMPSANRIVGYWNSIRFQMPVLDEIYDDMLLVRESRIQNEKLSVVSEVVAPMSFEHEISISHVRFCYPGAEQDVLRDVTYAIPKGGFVGIVGVSGAGKTTFVDILLGLLSPTSGDIRVDGKDISADIRAWQRNLAYVPQDIYLLDSSIRENIALGIAADEIDDERIQQVLQMAELDKFIQTLPDGIYTMVGERGVKLSGGQRQRIGIARALYPQPKILVLDEATSALDDATEKNIMDTILKFKGKLTIISIAHRLSTLAECDFKVSFKNGQAIVQGDSGSSI